MPHDYDIHFISHTHWDREWYRTFQHFRIRLVDLVDALIDLMESDPEYRHFHMDGQTILLEDYLEIRPEKEQRLRRLVQEGRILIGPWYNQPDEFIPSGESLIRNMMLGRRIGEDWGGWMNVGYMPDAFGHISQFPQLMRGFGVDSVVVFRGITVDQVKSEFIWRSPDGSEVLAIKLPDNNAYSNVWYRLRSTLTADGEIDFEQCRQQVTDLIADFAQERPTTSQLLFMDGVDHIFPNPKTPAIIRDINENMAVGRARHTTLPEYVAAVRAENPTLDTMEGEFRWGNRDWLLQLVVSHVMSSRIRLKQMNHRVQTLIEMWAEPFSTVAWTLGQEYPAAYLNLAWKYLLQNHPHDSICGCSIDQVHRDMVGRFEQALEILEPVTESSLQFIADRVDTSVGESRVAMVIFNPLSWERSEVVEALVGIPHEWDERRTRVVDADGEEVPFTMLGVEERYVLLMRTYDGPYSPPLKYCRLIFQASGVPSVGYRTYFVERLDTPCRTPGSLVTGVGSAENEYLALLVESDGTLTIIDRETGRIYTRGMTFEDGGDIGDGYTYVQPILDTVVSSSGVPARISLEEDGPLRATFAVRTTIAVPASQDPNGQERSTARVGLRITSRVSLAKGSRRVDIVSEVENTARDHRLRVLFPSGIDTDHSNAEGTFDVLSRPIHIPECRDWKEPLSATQPQKSFVEVSDGQVGLALINEGLPEYEVKDDGDRTMALTLLRCTGHGVGDPRAQVEGQLIGTHTFRYAVSPHAGDWLSARVWRESWSHNVPMQAVCTGIHTGELPSAKSFLSLSAPDVLLSAVKKADRSDDVIARVFNIGSESVDCRVDIDGMDTVVRTDLDEKPIGASSIAITETRIPIGRKQIVTLLADTVPQELVEKEQS